MDQIKASAVNPVKLEIPDKYIVVVTLLIVFLYILGIIYTGICCAAVRCCRKVRDAFKEDMEREKRAAIRRNSGEQKEAKDSKALTASSDSRSSPKVRPVLCNTATQNRVTSVSSTRSSSYRKPVVSLKIAQKRHSAMNAMAIISPSLLFCLFETWKVLDPELHRAAPDISIFDMESLISSHNSAPVSRKQLETDMKKLQSLIPSEIRHDRKMIKRWHKHPESFFAEITFKYLHDKLKEGSKEREGDKTFFEAMIFAYGSSSPVDHKMCHKRWISYTFNSENAIEFDTLIRSFSEESSSYKFAMRSLPRILSIAITRTTLKSSNEATGGLLNTSGCKLNHLPGRLLNVPLEYEFSPEYDLVLRAAVLRDTDAPYSFSLLLRSNGDWVLYTLNESGNFVSTEVDDCNRLLSDTDYFTYFLFYTRSARNDR
jgi:hypothetical protein